MTSFLYQLSTNLHKLLPKIPKLGNTSAFFLKDLSSVFESVLRKKFNVDSFLSNFNEFKSLGIIQCKKNQKYSVLFQKGNESTSNQIDLEYIKEIQETSLKNEENSGKVHYLCDSDDSLEIISEFVSPLDNNCVSDDSDGYLSMKPVSNVNFGSNSTVAGNYNRNVGGGPVDDESEIDYCLAIHPSNTNSNSNTNDNTNNSLKEDIALAFGPGFIIPVDSFYTVFCEVHGKAIDHRTAPCPYKGHTHPTISKFLRCYSDILQLKPLSKMYAIRKAPTLKQCPGKGALYKLSIEEACVNMFSTRVCIFFSDFLELYKIVYGSNPFFAVNGVPLQETLSKLRSPNIILVKKNGNYTITLCPVWHSEYVEWAENHRRMNDKDNASAVDVASSLCNAVFRTEKFKVLFGMCDLNVPRRVQLKCEVGLECEIGDLWGYLRGNINFDDSRSFFV